MKNKMNDNIFVKFTDNKSKVAIKILIEEKSGIERINEHVSIGIPFSKGLIFQSSDLFLMNQKSHYVPSQFQVLSRWYDGSIKWALLDFQASVEKKEISEYTLQCFDKFEAAIQYQQIAMQQSSNEVIVVDTGSGTFFINTQTFKPFERVVVQGVDVIGATGNGIVLTDDAGREYEPKISDISIEARGPLRVTLRVRGKFYALGHSSSFADFIARLSFYSNSSLVELKFTLRNPNAAQHPGGLWDLGDQGSVYFQDLSVHTTLASNRALQVDWTTHFNEPLRQSSCASIEIYQDSSGGENWQNSNHVNRFGKVMHAFQGYRVMIDGSMVQNGKRATPIVAVHDEEKSLAGAIDGFWQNFPKALEVQHNTLTLRVFPKQYSDVHELQGGEQKTHTVFLQYDRYRNHAVRLHWVHDRLIPRSTPEWYAVSKVFGSLTPHSQDKNAEYVKLVDSAIAGPNTFFDRREMIDEYGWRNFGDLYADHEAVGHKGEAPLVAHYNNQYDVIYGAIIQYVRSGDLRWFHLMHDLAKHVIDIDIYHTQHDRQAFNGGLFWHTEHYTDAATSTHRSYSKNRSSKGGGPACEHNYTTGLLTYYFLTGDTLAHEAVVGLGDWVINMDDAPLSLLGLFDNRPTGLCSATASRDYHGPGRGSGNSLNALIDTYMLTQEKKYLLKAEQLIRRCIHPRDDISSRNLRDIEHKWSYTVFLQILGKYLDFKCENNEIDYMYSYARQSLIHYAKWMIENEVPYKKVLDKVEIQTETWSAQDIRKSDVFKFAAKYSKDILRKYFMDKAKFFFETCIEDLISFETYNLTRPIVILMTNGFVNSCFQMHQDEDPPQNDRDYDFGQPQRFKQNLHELHKLREKIFLLMNLIKSARIRITGSTMRHRATSD